MLSEISPKEKPHILWFHLYEMSRFGKSIETEYKFEDAGGWWKARIGKAY